MSNSGNSLKFRSIEFTVKSFVFKEIGSSSSLSPEATKYVPKVLSAVAIPYLDT